MSAVDPTLPFSSLPLTPAMLENLNSLGYTSMTPVQAQSLPPMLEGRDVIAQANRAAELLRNRLNETIAEVGVNWVVYGEHSGFHFFTNPKDRDVSVADIYAGRVPADALKGSATPALIHRLRCGLILGGADIFPWPGGVVSAVHNAEDVETTATALKECLERLASE